MANVRDINQWLQDELARRGRPEVTPNEAAEWLDKAGLLRAGGTARGLPLRNLLRAGRIEGAEQRGSRWAIKRVLDGTTEEDLCRGWTESALREVVQKAIPLRRTILRAIAELDEPTMADVAAHVGVSDRTIPPNLTWAFKAVEPQVVDESGISWPMRFGRRGGLETYSMPDAVSDVILRELDLVEVSPGTVLVASLEDALRRRGLDDRTIQQDFDLSRASDGTLAAVLLVDGDNPAFAVERVAEHGRPSDSVTFDASTRSIRLERPLPESPERMADLALAMRDEIRRASSNLVKDGEELVEAAIRARRAPTTAAADRKAIEQRAVRLATDHFQHAGWSVRDVGSSRAYDLYLTKHDGSECFVEVKGTTGNGATVVLTANEVSVANERWPDTALAVVTGINLSVEEPEHATGGTLTVESPWRPDVDRLSALAFVYDRP